VAAAAPPPGGWAQQPHQRAVGVYGLLPGWLEPDAMAALRLT